VPTVITGMLPSLADEDVYRVCLTGNRTFSAGRLGSEVFDTQLFLFDAAGGGFTATTTSTDNLRRTCLRAPR
jgi:hypothetical protein